MKRQLSFVLLLCCVAASCLAAQKQSQPLEVKTFELYSWREAKGGWAFSLWPAISSAGLHPDLILRPSSTLSGQEKLKRAIDKLPSGSEILWLDHATGAWKNAKGWERIKYPTAEVIADIRTYCEGKGIKLSVEKAN